MNGLPPNPPPPLGGRRLFLVPFRAAVASVLAVGLLGGIAGAAGGLVAARRALARFPGSPAVVERPDLVTLAASDEALARAVEALAPSVLPVVDERGRTVGHALALTSDGLLGSAGPAPSGRLRVRLPDGLLASASLVRRSADTGIWFLKVESSLAPGALDRGAALRPGATVAAVASAPEGGPPRVDRSTVEALVHRGTALHTSFVGLAEVPKLDEALPPSFAGAPVVSAEGRVVGLVALAPEGTVVVPASALGLLLEDFLRFPDGTEVTVLSGLRGSFVRAGSGREPRSLTFQIVSVEPGSPVGRAGLRKGDAITTVGEEPLRGAVPLAAAFLDAARRGSEISVGVARADRTETVAVRPALQ